MWEKWFYRAMGFLIVLWFATIVWLFVLVAFDITVKYFRSFQ